MSLRFLPTIVQVLFSVLCTVSVTSATADDTIKFEICVQDQEANYVPNATVCYDLNDNGYCNANEPMAVTDDSGYAELRLTNSEFMAHKQFISPVKTVNKRMDRRYRIFSQGLYQEPIFMDTTEHKFYVYLNPVVTMIHNYAVATNVSFTEAMHDIAKAFVINHDSLQLPLLNHPIAYPDNTAVLLFAEKLFLGRFAYDIVTKDNLAEAKNDFVHQQEQVAKIAKYLQPPHQTNDLKHVREQYRQVLEQEP